MHVYIVVSLLTSARTEGIAAADLEPYGLFAINPLQVARYRERQSPSGAKSDAADAHLLAASGRGMSSQQPFASGGARGTRTPELLVANVAPGPSGDLPERHFRRIACILILLVELPGGHRGHTTLAITAFWLLKEIVTDRQPVGDSQGSTIDHRTLRDSGASS